MVNNNMIKTYGCSSTQYRWQTWPDFLKIFSKQTVKNFGISGASNEIISRTICKTAKKDDIIVVMWSMFDRVHSDIFYKKNKFCEGKYNSRSDRKDNNYAYSLEQLYDRSVEYIWLANKFCNDNNIKIYNFLVTIFELGETKSIQQFSPYLKIDHHKWPIDFGSFRLSHKKVGKEIKDAHPAPSEHYFYCKEVICPALGIKTFDIPLDQLKKLDDSRSEI